MPELKVVGEDSTNIRPRKAIEVHWRTPDGKYDVDIYPGAAIIDTDMTGLTVVEYMQEGEKGESYPMRVTYGYGETRKIVEIYE